MKLFYFSCILTFLAIIPSFGQTLDLEENFKLDLIGAGVDSNGDGEIQKEEALQVDSLHLGKHAQANNVNGIAEFENLKKLIVSYSDIDTLNVSYNKKLESLSVHGWYVRCVNADSLVNLKKLSTNMGTFQLSINGSVNIEHLSTSDNFGLIHDLPYNKLTKLKTLFLYGLPIFRELNLDNCVNLESLYLYPLLDIELEALTIKNGRHTDITFILNQYDNKFKYICTDGEEVDYIKGVLAENNITDIEVNSYCTFNDGGELKKIDGEAKVDFNEDGCDSDDPIMSILRYEITDLETGESEIKSTYDFREGYNGAYSIRSRPGSFSIKPLLNEPDYYTISPELYEITIEDYETESNMDFCLSPKIHKNDISVKLYPIGRARPGFKPRYQLSYANKGTTIASGEIKLKYDENLMKLISTSEAVESSENGEMIWSFDNLAPVEHRGISLVFELNRPTDPDFPLKGGEKLIFNTEIISDAEDSNLEDNTFTLQQNVVNSFDPNDIICLEGDEISFLNVGDYVHYMIRFENTGTAEAVNIVVKDTIDTEKFDIQSLRPLEGSHAYKSRINEAGEVEFNFENINLPFTEEEKHGYVLFKIRTKKSLIEGDQFSNNASIYFDFNFPIHTNTFETQVQGIALPVSLSSFNAVPERNQVNLDWNVLWEDNFSHYVVERRTEYDDRFKSIAKVDAINIASYTSIDNQISQAGTYYYRLSMVDNDGNTQYSDVVSVEIHDVNSDVMIYPNPANDYLVIENNSDHEGHVIIHNVTGAFIEEYTFSSMSSQQLDLRNISKGMYFVSIYKDGTKEVKKIFIDK